MLDGTVGKCAAPFLLWLCCSRVSLSLIGTKIWDWLTFCDSLRLHCRWVFSDAIHFRKIWVFLQFCCWKSECLCNPWSEICKPIVWNLGRWWKKVMHLHHPDQSAVWFFSIKGKKITLPNQSRITKTLWSKVDLPIIKFAHSESANTAQLITVQWYPITKWLNFKTCCDFKTFPSEMLIFCVWQWVITLPIVKKFVVGHFYHLFGQNKGKQHFFGTKRAIVCVWSLTCSITVCNSIAHGRICIHMRLDYFFNPPSILHSKFYLDWFKLKWRSVNGYRVAKWKAN